MRYQLCFINHALPNLLNNYLLMRETGEKEINSNNTLVIPVLEERAVIGKEVTETGTIRIEKQVAEREETVSISLSHDEHTIEHVSQNIYVDTIPVIRQEGDTMIIPVLQEVMVKRMLLVEEIRITKHTIQTKEPQQVTLRKESVTVERTQ